MLIKARAKINWTLDIKGEHTDGYHEMDMLMQSVELYDTLILEPSDELIFEVNESARVPIDDGNLIIKAANTLIERYGVKKSVKISLQKRIPIGSGMGGGSADAAATLAGLNAFWEINAPENELMQIAAELGADVPFCMKGGLQRAQGVGDKLTRLPVTRPAYLVVVQPCAGLSTRTVFKLFDDRKVRAYQRPQTERAIEAAKSGDLYDLCGAIGNVLQPFAIMLRPEIATAIQALELAGAVKAQMTGSGSAVYGVFETAWQAQAAWESISPIWRKCWTTRTASRALVFRNVYRR